MNALSMKTSAAATGSISAPVLLVSSAAEKSKQWQRELLMERIRSHASQQKTFSELSKSMRMSMLEKRYALDAVEKSNLQKCLDSMQHCIKVTSRQGLVERLESLSRQLGLKFMEDTTGLFISTDMFFLEIILDSNGALTDVKVHHECKIEQQSCSELVNCLNRGDFADFTVQLEGLSSIYQLNAEPKVKTKAFVALQAMETDLYNLFQMQTFTKDIQQLLEDSSVGIVLKRRGGHPMKLTYFVAPYDLISIESKCLQTLSLELLSSKDIGMSVTVNLEAASANKLQIQPTVKFAKDTTQSATLGGNGSLGGNDTPIYAPLTQVNSTLLPATFVLRLNKPLPVCSATLRNLLPVTAAVASSIGENVTTGIDQKTNNSSLSANASSGGVSTIMNLIVQTASEQQLKNSSKGLFVCLPDQTHCYFFTDNKQLKATLISSVPFTEPAQVPKILAFLKKQALFYTLLASCVRPQTKMGNDMDSTTILEVNAISFQQLSVSLQHPYEESMATVEFSLNDSTVHCTIYSISRNYDLLSLKLTKIAQKSLSIPVTLRALLKFWDQERIKMFQRGIGIGSSGSATGGGGNIGNSNSTQGTNAFGNFSLAMAPNDPGGRMSSTGNISVGNCSGNFTKMELNSSQRQFVATNSGAAGIAGYLKFKTDVKQEDFHESPKSQMQSIVQQSVEATSSLGQKTHQQVQQPQQQTIETPVTTAPSVTGISTDIEIADKYKNIWKDKTPNLKNTVSITPIMNTIISSSSSPSSIDSITTATASQALEMKRTGIEIIPLITQQNTASGGNTASTPNMAAGSSTITITPINSGNISVGILPKGDKKSTVSTPSLSPSSSNSATSLPSTKRSIDINSITHTSADVQKEKKRKKKRDDSPMGPPEKVFSRQNSPATTAGSGVEAVSRKFSSPSSSPKGSSGGMLATAAGSSLSARPSPKHSPVYSSPKHSTASNSPKSPFGTHSPKHGSSGKPSMSTLKSAAANLSPKSDKSNLMPVAIGGSVNNTLATSSVARSMNTGIVASASSAGGGVMSAGGIGGSVAVTGCVNTSTTKSRDKERPNMAVSSTTATSAKTNLAAVSLQQLKSTTNLNHLSVAGNMGAAYNASGGGGSAIANSPASLDSMRKGVSGAVSLMTSTTTSTAAATTIAAQHGIDAEASKLMTTSSEYMVKQSQEGLKLTINKTNSKNCTSSVSATASETKNPMISNVMPLNSSLEQQQSSTKKTAQHTGLKPGVNSGPASKKSPAPAISCSGSGGNLTATKKTTASTNAAKHIFQKSNSSGNLNLKLSSSKNANTSVGASTVKKTSDRSGNIERDRSSSFSQPATRFDHHADMMKILQYASPTMAANMEGFVKNLNNKFQIPKLSQRTASVSAEKTTATMLGAAASKSTTTATAINSTTSTSTVASVETTQIKSLPLKTPFYLQHQESQHQSYHQDQQKMISDCNNSSKTNKTDSQKQQSSEYFNNMQNSNERMQQQQFLINSACPPPPPYNASLTGLPSAREITTLSSQHHEPSLSVHILKSTDNLGKHSPAKDNSNGLFSATNTASNSTVTSLIGK